MKVLYIANARIPTEKANGKQIVKTCEAVAKAGISVELWLPNRKQPEPIKTSDLFKFYNVKRNFQVRKIPTIDFLLEVRKVPKLLQILAYYLQEISFDLELLKQNYICDVVYTRSITVAAIVKMFKKARVFYEIHNITENKLASIFHKFLWKQLDGLVAISQGLKKALEDEGLLALVAGDAVDPEEFAGISQVAARKKLSLDLKTKLVVYTGSLYIRKGVYDLAETAKRIGDSRTQFLLVGGTDGGKDVSEMGDYLNKNKINNVILTGFVSPLIIPFYLRAADILVLPSSAKVKESREYTSPMKLFEYLAAGRPILATATLANGEILIHNKNSYLVKPDDPSALTRGIKNLLGDVKLAEKLGKQAAQDSQKYNWEKRTRKIIEFISKK